MKNKPLMTLVAALIISTQAFAADTSLFEKETSRYEITLRQVDLKAPPITFAANRAFFYNNKDIYAGGPQIDLNKDATTQEEKLIKEFRAQLAYHTLAHKPKTISIKLGGVVYGPEETLAILLQEKRTDETVNRALICKSEQGEWKFKTEMTIIIDNHYGIMEALTLAERCRGDKTPAPVTAIQIQEDRK